MKVKKISELNEKKISRQAKVDDKKAKLLALQESVKNKRKKK